MTMSGADSENGPPGPEDAPPGEEAGEGEGAEVIELAGARQMALADDESGSPLPGESAEEAAGRVPADELEGVVESLLFASDKPLSLVELGRLTGEVDSRALAQAVESLRVRREGSGIEVAEVAGGFSLRTRVAHAPWVSKLLTGRPVRMSRALLEALAIIAYRQPITRPELDDIRGVDCGPVLKTLLDRGLIRIIGKKEEVGRPILYGTTPEFLRVFSLRDLTQLPTLRQFHELSAEHQATLEARQGGQPGEALSPLGQLPLPDPIGGPPPPWAAPVAPGNASSPFRNRSTGEGPDSEVGEPELEEDAALLEELEDASEAASRAARPLHRESEAPGGS
jgi:segregation and condensation protein B